ncbi:hypothetical protein LCGC14_0970760 [marine sediment metagenome]|uniref:Uncharacterized protein n=1 Tax=marine sediment metagenome TaxID=412755 RepID=A0A0F9NG91_9ZZZZ
MIEIVIASVAVVGVLITGTNQVLAWRRNGIHQAARDRAEAEKQAARDAVLANNQAAIIEKLDNPEYGLQAVNITVGRLTERVTGHDHEIKELKQKP